MESYLYILGVRVVSMGDNLRRIDRVCVRLYEEEHEDIFELLVCSGYKLSRGSVWNFVNGLDNSGNVLDTMISREESMNYFSHVLDN